jgi:hypothetical protein
LLYFSSLDISEVLPAYPRTLRNRFKQVKYVLDGSTIFWAIGHNSGVVARHAENCGKEVGMVVPFEDNTGEVIHLFLAISSIVPIGYFHIVCVSRPDISL